MKWMPVCPSPVRTATAPGLGTAIAAAAWRTTRYVHSPILTQHMNWDMCIDFQGENCETDLNSCRSDPCLNGGTCESRSDGFFVCTCPPGYTSFNCEYRDSCFSSPCGRGTCQVGAMATSQRSNTVKDTTTSLPTIPLINTCNYRTSSIIVCPYRTQEVIMSVCVSLVSLVGTAQQDWDSQSLVPTDKVTMATFCI